MMKKVLTVMIVLLAVVPLAAWGVFRTDVSAAGTGYTINGYTLTITGTGAMPDYGKSTDTPWYSKREDIRVIIVGDGVTHIGNNAFAGTSVMDVVIPNTVTSIGDYAFSDCKVMSTVKMPNSVTKIGIYSFSACDQLKNLTLSSNLEAIPERAFSRCSSLESLTIPGSVKSIGYLAFANCEKLVVTFSEGLETIGEKAFTKDFPTAPVGTANSVLIIPDSVTEIGKNAFEESGKLTKVITGKNLRTIGASAFHNCGKLDTVDLSRSTNLNSIEANAFEGTGVKSMVIPDSVEYIKDYAFCGCGNLTYVKLPENLKGISYSSFISTGLTSIEIPKNVTTIGRAAFRSTQITKVVIPANVTKISPYVFGSGGAWGSPLAAVDISSNKYLVLENNAFSETSLNHVHIPADSDVSFYAGKYGLPKDESCFFKVGADGKCSSAICPFRNGGGASGDLNNDGKLNNTDIILLGRSYMAGNASQYLAIADMNNDGKITNTDIILLGRLYMTGQ